MKFKIYKMNFSGAVHFGEGGLATSADTLMADTIFAALCSEAAAQGGDRLARFVESVKTGGLLFSDGLPFIDKTLYVPKPILEVRGREEGNSSIKKALKKLRFIPVEKVDAYLRGELDIDAEAGYFQERFSRSDLLEKVTVPEEEITRPYAVAVKRYCRGSGLYICAGYETEDALNLFTDLMENLSYAGIGGERSSGYGRFDLVVAGGGDSLIRRLQEKKAKKYMSLSVCLPAEEELEEVIQGAEYLTVKRSGWISSLSYADSFRKKRDLYMLTAGSVFTQRFSGDVFDVSEGGNHPVYRCGKPMLMGIL